MARPAELLSHRTLADLVFHLDRTCRHRENFSPSAAHGRLEGWSGADMLHKVHALAAAMGVGGIDKGDRIAIYAENRPEWHVVDFACQLYGAVAVPLFPTCRPTRSPSSSPTPAAAGFSTATPKNASCSRTSAAG